MNKNVSETYKNEKRESIDVRIDININLNDKNIRRGGGKEGDDQSGMKDRINGKRWAICNIQRTHSGYT